MCSVLIKFLIKLKIGNHWVKKIDNGQNCWTDLPHPGPLLLVKQFAPRGNIFLKSKPPAPKILLHESDFLLDIFHTPIQFNSFSSITNFSSVNFQAASNKQNLKSSTPKNWHDFFSQPSSATLDPGWGYSSHIVNNL